MLVMQLEIIKKVSLLNKNTILFVHGAYHAAWCWEEHFIPFFYAHGYNVYAMSFRNHGNSERIENVDQIVVKDMVGDVCIAGNPEHGFCAASCNGDSFIPDFYVGLLHY